MGTEGRRFPDIVETRPDILPGDEIVVFLTIRIPAS